MTNAPSLAVIDRVRSVHTALFGKEASQATPLIPLSDLAAELGVKAVYIKDEASRLGMGAFKVLGASWAICSLLADRYGVKVDDIQALRERGGAEGITIYAATAGNHGRAVAKTATLLGLSSRIYVPSTTEQWSRESMTHFGAECIIVPGDYDDAYKKCADDCVAKGDRGLLVQDTSWEGYEDIPMRIIMGYTTLFHELTTQLPYAKPPTHLIVPVGVGSLAHASVLYSQSFPAQANSMIITVEPTAAACLRASLLSGALKSVQTESSIMAGLNCGTVSRLSWPALKGAVRVEDTLVVEDNEAEGVMRELEEGRLGPKVKVGACGAATVVGARKRDGWSKDDVVVLICSEGRVKDILGVVDM